MLEDANFHSGAILAFGQITESRRAAKFAANAPAAVCLLPAIPRWANQAPVLAAASVQAVRQLLHSCGPTHARRFLASSNSAARQRSNSLHSAAALTHGRHFERGATRTAAAVTYPATAADPDPATTFLK